MPKLDGCTEIVTMARELKLDHTRPVEAIISYCRQRIAGWVRKAGGANSLSEVQDIVCQNLGLTLIDIHSDEELDDVAVKYVKLGETVFASLAMQLTDDKFATVIRREHAATKAADRYVAIIDCRGFKGARRFFTRWHEIAHILTLVTQYALPFQQFRGAETDPIERLMDIIAGEVGFYEPVFQPPLAEEIKLVGRLTFEGVERVRTVICPDASFQATLIACTKRASTPVIQLEAVKRFKKAEEAELSSRQLHMFARPRPKAKLRAFPSVPNLAAKNANFRIHPNMQIPDESLIAGYFNDNADVETAAGVAGIENFSNWRCSDGTVCGQGMVFVEVQKLAGTVIAILQPKPKRYAEEKGYRVA